MKEASADGFMSVFPERSSQNYPHEFKSQHLVIVILGGSEVFFFSIIMDDGSKQWLNTVQFLMLTTQDTGVVNMESWSIYRGFKAK